MPALIILIMAQWTTNDNNLYTSSLGIANMIPVKKKKITLIVGIIATLIGTAGLADYFITWLSILGIGLPPMAGIIIADYYVLKKGHYEFGPGTKYCNWGIIAFISWFAACVVGYTASWGIASINSLVVGFVVYLVLMKALGKNSALMVGECIEE